MKKDIRFRQMLFVGLIFASPIVTGLVLLWLFSLDGTMGLYQWVQEYHYLFIAIGVLGVAAPLTALAARLITRGRRALNCLAIAFAILGILISLAVVGYSLPSSLEFSTSIPPMLLIEDGAGKNGVPNLALVFRTASETQNTLYFGVESLSENFTEARATHEHVLPLRNLLPGTRYQWRLNDGAIGSFTMPSVQATSDVLYHFGASSDAHFGTGISGSKGGDPNVTRSILEYVTAPGNQFHAFFIVGDSVNLGSTNGNWQSAIETLAPFSYGIPLRPLMGNHDAMINGAPHYLAYFYPEGMETPIGTRLYYRVDCGRVHFIMLNMLWGVESFSAEQRAWFVKQMESIPPDDWTIVMMHSMVYSSGSVFGRYTLHDPAALYDPPDMVQQVAPLLERYKVDLVISGHNHHLEFLQKNGVSYAIVGGLGGTLGPGPNESRKSLAYVWQAPKQYGFLDVTVRSNTTELHFRCPNGTELNAFSIGKNL
jgi:hypothetical protein